MNQVSIVFQDTNLFKMSIADNVAFYTPGASRANILRALHLAQCDDILEKLPDAHMGAEQKIKAHSNAAGQNRTDKLAE